MAAIYDEQGNYVGDDGAPSLDQMKLELVKKNQPLSAQIPGYDRPIPQAQTKPDPLGSAAGNFTELATKFNPLMMAKSMREAAGIVTVPAVAAVKGVGESILTSPAGTYTSGKAPAYAEQVAKQFMEQNAPQTPMTQEFAGAIAPYMAELPAYLGHLQTGRPAFTPNDLRVMGAEATRVGRQVKDIPTDFVNAQSGLQKLDPITGQPTMGARLGQAERGVMQAGMQFEKSLDPIVQDIMAKGGTSADILAAMAGQPLYAMRPEGSRLTSAVIPETSKVSPYFAVTKELVSDVVGDGTISPLQTLEDIRNRYLRQPGAEDASDAFFNFLKNKAVEMYPDAPSQGEALDAYKARFSDKAASAPHTLQMYNEFLQTPEGASLAARVDMPTAEEVVARHEAAVNWLNSQFTNYINEKVGTPNEPGIKLAGQGLTYAPRGDVMESGYTSPLDMQRKREQAGMPAYTPTDRALDEANTQLQTLQQQAIDALTAKREQTQAAIDAGYGAPGGPNLGQFEPFAQASRAADKATAALDKQRKLVDNLQLGAAYENAIDTGIKARPAGELLSTIPYEERQFYPALQKTPVTEKAYTANASQLKNLGFGDMARNFYDDVMAGKIPLDKVPKMTVEKYIRSVAEPRVAKEKAEQAAQAGFKAAVDEQFKRSADAHIPNDKVFGNVGALEITDKFTPEEVAKLVSEDTTALDVCIGEGGIRRDLPNLWHPGTGNRQYVPIYNVATGERNPDAPSPRPTYINAVINSGSQMVSFRDTVTGEPVAIFDFNPSSKSGKYNINFASGRANGVIKPEYVEGIKSYLNSREDSINDAGDNLYNHAGIVDSKRMENRTLAGMIDMPISQFAKYDLSGLPRFITRADLRNYIETAKANAPVEQVPAAASQRPSESLNAYATGAVSSAIDNVIDSQRRLFEEAGEGERFTMAETFFNALRNRFNEDLSRGFDPSHALSSFTQRLYDLENEYANSNTVARNLIADGIIELMQDVGMQHEYIQQRQAAEAMQPRPFAQRAEPEARPDYLRMTHDAALDLSRQMGEDAGDELRSALRAITEGSGIDPVRDTDAFITALRGAADVAARGSVETALNELADRMESEYMRDWEPEEAPAAQQPFALEDYNRYVNELRDIAPAPVARDVGAAARIVAETNMGYNAWGAGLREQPIEFATGLLQQADSIDMGLNTELDNNPRTAQALREVAQQIMRRAQPPAPAAPAQPFDFARLVDGIVDEVLQNTDNPGVGNRIETIAYRVAERTNPRLDPEGYAQALRRVITDTDHVAVGPALRALADRIHLERFAEEPAPRQPREADLANQRNDRIFELENAVNNPELNPDDLRSLANRLGNPLTHDDNNHWISLTDTERRAYSQELHQRANYIEFNPADFAIRLSNEADANIPELRDTIEALNAGNFDHEILRGLPVRERGRAEQRTAMYLTHILQGIQDDAGRRGNADGGPVRGYQAGGSVKKPEVKTPWLGSISNYSDTVAYEMYPGQRGQDDQRDAARHMLAAGTLSRKYGPGTAEFLGKAHEYVTSPLQAVKTLFGGKMPADFDMDTHNNAVGARLGQRAKTQAELEDLVQEEAERASRTQTPDKAFIRKANGGIVQQNPTTDQMRYALMMRRK